MSREIAHNESSANEGAGARRKTKPTAIELQDTKLADTRRDSGCYSASPYSGASISRSSTATRFTFGADSTIPTTSSSLQEMSSASADHFETSQRDDTDDEMFAWSYDDDDNVFLDSGLGREEDTTPQTGGRRRSPVYRQSPLAAQSRVPEVHNDSDDDSSTEEEYSTAELELRSSPSSTPIPIPPVGSSTLRRSLPEPQVSSLPLRTDSSEPSHVEPLLRLHGNLVDRPSSGNARLENIQSLPHAPGSSLPDVVPIGGRDRAYSEGVLNYVRPDVEAIGNSLRDICDEFSRFHMNKQQAKNQIEQLRSDQVRMRQRPTGRRPLPHSASMPNTPSVHDASEPEPAPNRSSRLHSLVEKYYY